MTLTSSHIGDKYVHPLTPPTPDAAVDLRHFVCPFQVVPRRILVQVRRPLMPRSCLVSRHEQSSLETPACGPSPTRSWPPFPAVLPLQMVQLGLEKFRAPCSATLRSFSTRASLSLRGNIVKLVYDEGSIEQELQAYVRSAALLLKGLV